MVFRSSVTGKNEQAKSYRPKFQNQIPEIFKIQQSSLSAVKDVHVTDVQMPIWTGDFLVFSYLLGF